MCDVNMLYIKIFTIPITLTGSYHLVHTWYYLFAELVARPTHKCPVIEWRQWRVGSSAPRSLLSVTVTIQVDRFSWVVETPSVLDIIRWVSLYFTQYFSSFSSAHSLHRLLAGSTYRGDWKYKKEWYLLTFLCTNNDKYGLLFKTIGRTI